MAPSAPDGPADEVCLDMLAAQQLGVRGVPLLAFDRRLGVSGAQSVDVLLDALGQAWAEAVA